MFLAFGIIYLSTYSNYSISDNFLFQLDINNNLQASLGQALQVFWIIKIRWIGR